MFKGNNIDNFVQFYTFETFEYLFRIERNTKFLKHRYICARAKDFTVDQRTVAVEKYRFYLGHVFPLSLV